MAIKISDCCKAIIIGTGFESFKYICSKCKEPIGEPIIIHLPEDKEEEKQPYKFSKG